MSWFPDTINTNTKSKYTKIKEGLTKIRILSEPITGTELWVTKEDGSRTPKRYKLDETIPVEEIEIDLPKEFLAVKVYNYKEKGIQVWQITQKSILKQLKAYSDNLDYGSPLGYNITVTREGQAMKTRYTLVASPPKEVNDEVKKANEETPVNLDALYINSDPFFSTK